MLLETDKSHSIKSIQLLFFLVCVCVHIVYTYMEMLNLDRF